jgi:meromycolic acid enoyl-[acyl-carrier-protein] reductase
VILEGKRILITGVVNRHSIAYAIAERAQREGAELVLTSFGRMRRMTERAASRLDPTPDVLELDVNRDEDLAAVAEELRGRWDGLDGALHAIANAPPDALGGNFLSAPRDSAKAAFETSAYSLKALAEAIAPLMGDGSQAESNGTGSAGGGGIVAMDFDASVAWPAYDWMGVSKAALESVSRYLARDLGPRGVRVNLISAGPISTPAASGIPGFGDLAGMWSDGAPLGWDTGDASAVADAAIFLLSDMSRAISGEIVHVDGGFHCVGAPGHSVDSWQSDSTTSSSEPDQQAARSQTG